MENKNFAYHHTMNADLQSLIPVPHLQNEEEFKLFLWMYENYAPEKVIEIGSFFGASLYSWIKFNADLYNLTSVDLSIGPGDGRYQQMLDSKAQWEGWTKKLPIFNRIEGNSQDTAIISQVNYLYPDKDVDMLFIDADHAYSSVIADFNNYQALVKPGGWIVFHDTFGYPEVRQAFKECINNNLHFEIYKPGKWGISTIIKK